MAAVDPLEIKRRSFVKNNARLPEELQSLARTMPLDKDQMIFLTANTFIGSKFYHIFRNWISYLIGLFL